MSKENETIQYSCMRFNEILDSIIFQPRTCWKHNQSFYKWLTQRQGSPLMHNTPHKMKEKINIPNLRTIFLQLWRQMMSLVLTLEICYCHAKQETYLNGLSDTSNSHAFVIIYTSVHASPFGVQSKSTLGSIFFPFGKWTIAHCMWYANHASQDHCML